MNLLRKLFERKYNVKKCYVVRLAKVLDLKKSGIYTPGYTYSTTDKLLLTAKKTKHDKFSLLTRNLEVYSDHNQTKFKGDIFTDEVHPMTLFTKKRYISTSELKELEITINKEIIAELEKENLQ